MDEKITKVNLIFCATCIGRYYNYEYSKSRYHNSIMADQMAGQWYLRACEIGQHPDDRVNDFVLLPNRTCWA